MAGRLEGRAAVVTGGGNGIGAAICRLAAAEGATVACVDVDGAAARRVADDIVAGGGRALAEEVDLADLAATERAVAAIRARTGRIHALFANAGGSRGEARPFLEMTPADWRTMLDRNLESAFNTGLVVARAMAGDGGGAIVYTTSQLSLVVRPGLAHYAASKGAVAQLVRAMALDLAAHGIRVNAVAPGPTETPGNAAWFARPEVEAEHRRSIPLGRVARPEEVAPAALHLASDEASFTTGATLVVDGGYTIV